MLARQMKMGRPIFTQFRYKGTQKSITISGVTGPKFINFLNDVTGLSLLMHTFRWRYSKLLWNSSVSMKVVSINIHYLLPPIAMFLERSHMNVKLIIN